MPRVRPRTGYQYDVRDASSSYSWLSSRPVATVDHRPGAPFTSGARSTSYRPSDQPHSTVADDVETPLKRTGPFGRRDATLRVLTDAPSDQGPAAPDSLTARTRNQ